MLVTNLIKSHRWNGMRMKETKFKQTEIGKIPEDWKIVKQGDIAKFINGRAYKYSEFKKSGTPIVRIQNLTGEGTIVYSDLELPEEKYIVKGDLIYAWSATFGPHIWDGPKSIYHYHIWKIVCNEKILDKHFFYYKLKYISDKIRDRGTGSIFTHITKQLMESYEIPVPPLPEQKAIARILSSLDDKIELNHRMNKTLEAITQAIFKHWFVDFEFPNGEGKPYRSSGGEMVYNEELGKEIPKGWKVGELGSIIKITSGKRPKQKSEKEDDVFKFPLVGSSKIMGFVKEPLFREPVLAIGRVGTHGVVQRFDVPTFPSDNTLVIISPFYEYVYQILKRIDYESLNVGSTQPLITQTAIKNYRVIIPPEGILMLFEQKVSILFKKIHKNEMESKNLAKIRDTLLPKLMSGEIRVKIEVK